MAGNTKTTTLELVRKPKKTYYHPGQKIKLDGIQFTLDEEDVTNLVEYDLDPDYVWRAGTRKIKVTASIVKDNVKYEKEFELKRKILLLPFLLMLTLTALAIESFMLLNNNLGAGNNDNDNNINNSENIVYKDKIIYRDRIIEKPVPYYEEDLNPDNGSQLIRLSDEMSKDEAQKMLNKMAEKSIITVSVAPRMELKSNGTLRINFAVKKGNNGLSERMELRQQGKLIYKTGVVDPGYMIEWTNLNSNAVIGDAIATVYAVNKETGRDSGNPVSVNVEIVNEGEGSKIS